MKKLLRVSLKIKILGLVLLLIVFVIFSLSILYILMKLEDDMEKAKDLSLQTAKTFAYMPVLQEYFKYNMPINEIDLLIDQMKNQVEPMTVYLQNRNGSTFATTDTDSIYKKLHNQDQDKALVYGSSYVYQTRESDRQIFKAVAPIIVDYGHYKKVEGTVVILYDMDTIYDAIWGDVGKVLHVSIIIFIVGIIGSYLLANSIRKDTLNLEPYEIAAMYRERNAILQSVKEGIVAVDDKGFISMMNSSAHQLLEIDEQTEQQQLSEVISSNDMLKIFTSSEKQMNIEMQYKDKMVIVNTQPIMEEGKRIGVVASFRDRTEIKRMIDALSEVKQYSDDLRAQAHEFTNKLYAIMGLLQLGKKEEAMAFIKAETHLQTLEEDLLFTRIQDEKIQAILLGKMAQASEKKIQFLIDQESSLDKLPAEFPISSLIIIVGNLINNAFEAVTNVEEKTVKFFVTDIGNEIIFEILDSGKGIRKDLEEQIFQKGFSTKGKNRGYGLGNMKEEVESLGGMMEFTSEENKGTIFTVYLPKSIQGGESGWRH